jgi:hypothetical protein
MLEIDSLPFIEKIPKSKHQISNKFQIRNINDRNEGSDLQMFGIWIFGHWILFVICDL